MALAAAIIVTLLVFLVILIFYFILIYNSLVSLKNNIHKSWANIDVLLKQRSDELPNLIETVKGYMKHEKNLLTEITKARSEMLKSSTMSAKASADNIITGALKTIFAVSESYPKLQANKNFLKLQERITGLENELADRREFYNDSVTIFNTKIQSFPDMFVAGLMNAIPEQLFKVTEEESKVVKSSL